MFKDRASLAPAVLGDAVNAAGERAVARETKLTVFSDKAHAIENYKQLNSIAFMVSNP